MPTYLVAGSKQDLKIGMGVEVIASSPLEALRKYMGMGNPYAETMAVECPCGDVVMGMELLPDESRSVVETESESETEGGAE